MEQSNYTPGPWHIDGKMVGNVMGERLAYRVMGAPVRGRGPRCVAEVQCLDFAEGKPNALLIEAAPELAEALDDARYVIEKQQKDGATFEETAAVLDSIRAALRKAGLAAA